jgi:hypothetical protein
LKNPFTYLEKVPHASDNCFNCTVTITFLFRNPTNIVGWCLSFACRHCQIFLEYLFLSSWSVFTCLDFEQYNIFRRKETVKVLLILSLGLRKRTGSSSIFALNNTVFNQLLNRKFEL